MNHGQVKTAIKQTAHNNYAGKYLLLNIVLTVNDDAASGLKVCMFV